MNVPECARRRDLLLGAVRWAAASDEVGWVLDPRSGTVHLTPRLENLLGWPTPTADVAELGQPELMIRAELMEDGSLRWSDPMGVIRSRCERVVVRDCCSSCEAAPIQVGLLFGLAPARSEADPERVLAAAGGTLTLEAEPAPAGVAIQRVPAATTTPKADPCASLFERLAELYADVPEEYQRNASRRYRHRAPTAEERAAAILVLVFLAVSWGLAALLLAMLP